MVYGKQEVASYLLRMGIPVSPDSVIYDQYVAEQKVYAAESQLCDSLQEYEENRTEAIIESGELFKAEMHERYEDIGEKFKAIAIEALKTQETVETIKPITTKNPLEALAKDPLEALGKGIDNAVKGLVPFGLGFGAGGMIVLIGIVVLVFVVLVVL